MKSNNIYLYVFLIMTCCSCHLLEPTHHTPYVEIIYTINGEQKQYQEDKHGGFGFGQKYWVEFMKVDAGEHIMFCTDACHQNINISSDEGVFRDGKKYYYDNLELQDLYFAGNVWSHYETGWFSFHIIDDGVVCFEVSFDTEWSDYETGNTINVAGSLYVYDKYYGKYWGRVYRRFIVPEE